MGKILDAWNKWWSEAFVIDLETLSGYERLPTAEPTSAERFGAGLGQVVSAPGSGFVGAYEGIEYAEKQGATPLELGAAGVGGYAYGAVPQAGRGLVNIAKSTPREVRPVAEFTIGAVGAAAVLVKSPGTAAAVVRSGASPTLAAAKASIVQAGETGGNLFKKGVAAARDDPQRSDGGGSGEPSPPHRKPRKASRQPRRKRSKRRNRSRAPRKGAKRTRQTSGRSSPSRRRSGAGASRSRRSKRRQRR